MRRAIKIIGVIVLILAVLILVRQFTKADEPVYNLSAVDLVDPFMGPEDASIVVIEYSDFQCPFCVAAAGFYNAVTEQFKRQMPSWSAPMPGLKKLAEEGKIKLVFKHFPLSFHQYSQKAAEAAEAANAQGKFWEYHDKLYSKNSMIDESVLIQIAEEIGLDVYRFKVELNAGVYADSVKKDLEEGLKAGVDSTPSFLVDGKLISGAQPFFVFEQEINKQG